MRRKIIKCPQSLTSGPRLQNLRYDVLLTLEYTKNTKVVAYSDDLMTLVKGTTQVELGNYTNIETQKAAK